MIRDNFHEVKNNIEQACKRCGRNPEEVTLIAVSKTKPISMIEEAILAGASHFGENKVQELCEKIENIKNPLHWHMIGHLQRNKVKYIINKGLLIHSVDSLSLAEQINKDAEKAGVKQDILIEINIGDEESKYGFRSDEVMSNITKIAEYKSICIKGLMCVAPFTENAEENRIYFRKMRQLYVDINDKNIDNVNMNMLSMGMTGDYEVAIEEGATLVRVGTGIFGERNYNL